MDKKRRSGSTAIKPLVFLRARYSYIFPSSVALPVQQDRIDVIQSRIRFLAITLAFFIPAWSVLDFFAFPRDLWVSLLEARFLAGCAFAVFYFSDRWLRKESLRNLLSIYIQLGIIFVIPTLFYVFCIDIPVQVAEPTSFASAITRSYYLMPFVILAGMGFFPLTMLEAASIVTPFLTAYYICSGAPELTRWSTPLGMMWSMTLLAAIAIATSVSQLGILIQLVSYASYDLLTNCLGRRSGEEVVKAIWNYSQRNKSNLSFAFIDLDHFKVVNDKFGHQAGDQLLAIAASTIKSKLRESDFVIRWGGEEFLVLLPDANIENAMNVCTRMAEHGFGLLPDGSTQMASIGIAERLHEQGVDKDSIIRIADERLYKAKTSGRARIVGSETVVLRG